MTIILNFGNIQNILLKELLGNLKPALNLSILKQPNGELTDDPDQIKSIISNHFKKVLQEQQFTITPNWQKTYEPKKTIPNELFNPVCLTITKDELDQVLTNMANDKMPGNSTIPYEAWIHLGTKAKEWLLILFNKLLISGSIPPSMEKNRYMSSSQKNYLVSQYS